MARTTPKFFKCTALFALMTACLQSTYAGVVRDDVNYQQFRDFAENKGKFSVGASNIEIKDKNGNVAETMFADGVSMPDWSAVNTFGKSGKRDDNGAWWLSYSKGHATLIDPQYIVSVNHNGILQDVGFGVAGMDANPDVPKFEYNLIKRNAFPAGGVNNATTDYNQPRLHKLVTEVVPIETVNGQHSLKSQAELEAFKKRYPLLLRIGGGTQEIINTTTKETKHIAGAYQFLTGGNMLDLIALTSENAYSVDRIQEDVINMSSERIYQNLPLMATYGLSGDSGSPIFAYDNEDKKWKFLATWQGSIEHYYATLNKYEFNEKVRKEDNNKDNIANSQSGKQFDWKSSGNISTISSEGNQFNLAIYDENAINADYFEWFEKARLATNDDDRKNAEYQMGLIAHSQWQADIKTKLNHGKNLRISGEKGTLNLKSDINQGAGALYFDTDFTVKGENENITWLGAGVSVAKDKTVIWQIKNPENDRLSKIGEGVLLVNGQGENKGDISVGDGLVILNQQGGKAFNKVGIVSGRPTVKLETSDQVTEDNIYFGYRGGRLDVNGNDLTFNYIKNVDEGAKIVNHHADKTATVTIKTDATDPNKSAFNGVFGENNQDFFGNPLKDKTYHNGKLNIIYAPENPQENKPFLLSGGTNLNGNLTVENGSLLLSGRPTPHAYDHLYKDDNGNQVGIEPFKDDDWINRHFSFTNLIAKNNTTLHIGRNIKTVNGNIELNNATAYIGFINGKTPVCVRSDYHGTTECTTPTYTDQKVLDHIIATNVTGNITLNDKSDFTLGKAHLTGEINANKDSNVTLNKDAKWIMTDSSKLGHLNMEDGSEITLNANFTKGISDKFNLLTVAGNLTGQGQFNYLTHLSGQKGDKVVVEGIASGNYTLNVKETGQEPASPQQLVLLDLQNQNQTDKELNVQLTNAQNAVDLGAWRYELQRMNGNQYTLVGKHTPPTTTPPTQMIVNSNTISKYTNLALSAQYANLRTLAHTSTLGGRLLDVSPKYAGVWVHTKHGEFERASEYYRRYNDEQNLVQFGVDDDFAVGKGVLVAGVALSHAKGNQTFDEGAGDSRLTMGHLYGKWLSDKGVFVGADTGYGRVRQEVTLGKQVDYTQKFANVGVIAGKNWQFGRAFVEPSVGIRHYRALDGQGYALDGAKVQLHEFSATAYQPSIKVGYTHQTDTGLTFSPYVSTTYGHWTGDTKLAVNGYQFSVPLVNEWQHKLGFDLQKGKFSGQLYTTYDKDKESGDGYSVGLNVGYRW